jgi:hypothetical protein
MIGLFGNSKKMEEKRLENHTAIQTRDYLFQPADNDTTAWPSIERTSMTVKLQGDGYNKNYWRDFHFGAFRQP